MRKAILQAKEALAGDSNDAEHYALVALLSAMGIQDMPECTCLDHDYWWDGRTHNDACPVVAWITAETEWRGSELYRELDALKRWKREAIRATPDYQEIGKELGLPLGTNVSSAILPSIRELKENIRNLHAKLRAVLSLV